jgi:hypothetical protein
MPVQYEKRFAMIAAACPDERFLQQFLVGQMSESDAEQVEGHLAECSWCLQAAQTLRCPDTLITLARAGVQAPGPVRAEVDPRLLDWFCSLRRFMPESAGPVPGTESSSVPAEEQYTCLAPAQEPDEMGRLGPYRILKVIGSGGMGVVFLAEDLSLRRRVALKILKPVLAASSSARQRFLREAQAAAAIEHDHIVTIFHVGEDRGVPFLAMPLLQGESLEDRLRREARLPLSEVLRIGRETAEGLAAAHACGLIHRDIKPANLWLETRAGEPGALSPRTRVKILDFGLARAGEAAAALTQPGAIMGTPAYMAPEQARGEAVDHRADLFSLGCVLYRMGTGEMPFPGRTALAVLAALLTRRPRAPAELNPALSPALSNLVMQLLAPDREERPTSARRVCEALAAIAGELPRGAAPAAGPGGSGSLTAIVQRGSAGGVARSFGQRIRRAVSRRLVWVGLAGAVLVAAAGLAIVPLLSREADEAPRDRKQQPAAAIAGPKGNSLPLRRAWRGGVGPISCLCFNREGTHLAVVGLKGLKVWDAQTPTEAVTPPGGMDAFAFVTYSPDGKRLAAGGMHSAVKIWDAHMVEEPFVRKIEGDVRRLAYRGDGKRLALCTISWGNHDLAGSQAQVWDAQTGRTLLNLSMPPGGMFNIAYSPNGRLLAESGGEWDKKNRHLTNGWLRLCDAATGRQIFNLKGHEAGIVTVAFSPDGKELASASGDCTVRVWDAKTGRQRRVLGKYDSAMYLVLYSPDGNYLVATGNVKLRLWSAATGQQLASFQPHAGNISWVAFNPDGKYLATGGVDEMVKLWDLPPAP